MMPRLPTFPTRLPRLTLLGAVFLVHPVPADAQQRVDPIPAGPEAVVEALSPFSANPDSNRVARIVTDAARDSGFPASDYDLVLVARLWRRAGQTVLALKSLENVVEGGEAENLVRYEAARVLLETAADSRITRALGLYWSACDAMDEPTRAEIVWDLLPVSTPEERERWASSGTQLPTCTDVHEFWNERAQRMAISADERIELHFRRLADARERYYLNAPRHLAGMADSFGRSPGLAVDDRGLLLIRMGEPDYEQPCPEESPKAEFERNLLGQCWVYWRPAGYRIYYLGTRDRFGVEWPYGDYRIQEDLGDQAEPGSEFFQKYVMNADIPDRLKQDLVRRGSVSREEKLAAGYEAIPGIWDLVHRPDELLEDLDGAEALTVGRRIKLATRANAAAALERIPDAPDIESTLRQRMEALRFLNPSSGLWQVWLLGSVRAGDLTPSSDSAGATLDISGRYSTITGDSVAIGRLTHRSVSAAAVPDEAGLALRGVLTASPGILPLTFVAEDLNRPGTGAWIQDTIRVPSVGGLPQISDIAVAQAEGGSWTRDGETFLQVSPAHVTNGDGSIHTYFEVYGVRGGARYDVELRLAPVDVADRIWRLEPDDLGFRLQFTTEMPGDIGRHHLRLDLSDTEPGEYTLAVRIQDEQSKAYSLPAVTDIFVAER